MINLSHWNNILDALSLYDFLSQFFSIMRNGDQGIPASCDDVADTQLRCVRHSLGVCHFLGSRLS